MTLNLDDKGLRYQAQAHHDAAARKMNSDTSHTSRPDAVPTWDDLDQQEKDEVMARMHEDGELYDYVDTGVPWHGSETAVIESGTNPWLEGADGPINLEVLVGMLGNEDSADCPECGGLLDGVLNMDSECGIQRCDTCMVYEGDLIAAKALRDAHFPDATIWFHGTN